MSSPNDDWMNSSAVSANEEILVSNFEALCKFGIQ